MLSPLQYHEITTRFLQNQSLVWQFFASHNHKEEQLKQFKADLLKNTYKFDDTAHPELYKKVNLSKEKLDLPIPVVLYQAQHTEEMNASIVYINGEVHIVFSGKIMQLLSDDELLAIIAHELSHVKLYTRLNGDVEVADRIITTIANHQGSTPAHYETARLFKLYTEIYCDRGAYIVTENYAPIVASLVKISTGLQAVNANSYIKQAEEIFAAEADTKTGGVSHPENFIRARAIWLWHKKGHEAEQEIKQMIEGSANLDELDLFKQCQVSFITEELITLLLQPQWMQSPQVIALGKQYFGQLQLSRVPDKNSLLSQIETTHDNIKDYLTYVLYDFATADKALEDIPLGYCFFLADELKLDKAFANAVKKERKLTDKKISVLKKQTLASFHEQQMMSASV